MKVFGYNRKGFLYIDTGSHLISQQVSSDASNMLNKYSTLKEFENYDVAAGIYYKEKDLQRKEAYHKSQIDHKGLVVIDEFDNEEYLNEKGK